ncbi:MAG: DNA-3-methyladenine glycosylase I [Euryarchaeota archaeon]|jgi:DNA-3-methyladenine glycosylase I|nr:DNA-3-methyladenine glycosylase I [Euryarchaeota archaeon]MBT3654497.1 DNA-3-methyladenine glycosylase I [Euryarchaeota archaeon]MBT3757953.1 DNA-3-methyladenine glycosylase I [Euryarchaeota archaeon]MBT4050823.1 DNA-3-methyladenine glycosylase I [Euryarchaeota archaeon]MBT4650827.1 DNA-3-methyladenine glycosylase I [Euryarchaeota archaeon]|tara:strand:- start:50 stop:646 length:597 start_codon:yes stop_codon:yes gene_type:complete
MTELVRCEWSTKDPLYISYHDKEWGRPNRDGRRLFEKIILEGAQAGLSWITILKKRENYRRLFDGFDPTIIAAYDEGDIERLMGDAGIIRNRAKINSAINNARVFVEHFGTDEDAFSDFLWGFVGGEPIINQCKTMDEIEAVTEISTQMSKALKKMGFSFIGPTTCYAMMQAAGMVDDHLMNCFCHTSNRNGPPSARI